MPHIETNYDFLEYFPANRRIYSCAVGASKPDPLIFRAALQACKVKAEQAVYIDDIGTYVEAAKRLGMAGIQFQTPEKLIGDLRGLGVEVERVSSTK